MIQDQAIVPVSMSRLRFDRVAADLFPEYSRARLQQWIHSGELTINGETQAPRFKVDAGSKLVLKATPEVLEDEAEDIPLHILFEDEDVLVLDKPDGLVVHPGAGNRVSTLLNALLHHCPELEAIPRAGIVHRLDKRTTGLMVVAKTLPSQHHLVKELQERRVKRIYEALVYGVIVRPGHVDAPMGRHRTQRTKMSIRQDGKEAITHYRTLETFDRYTHVELSLETGRTHQIRVHMQHIGHPLIGDATYGGHFRQPPHDERIEENPLADGLRQFPRQALHARHLSFEHPRSHEPMTFTSPLAEDMEKLLLLFKENARS